MGGGGTKYFITGNSGRGAVFYYQGGVVYSQYF